jgi:creatinine amidohydrolase/Fe(II)-dependent formamide hydrolase-like protein
MRRTLTAVIAIASLSITLAAQQTASSPPQGRGGRGQQTPEQREAAARQAYEREMAFARPIPARDSVWIEELTKYEVRDAIKSGKTTALVIAGSTEDNGPYTSTGKHQYAIRLVGEAIARKLGNALVAPIVPIEAGNPDNQFLSWGTFFFTPETYQAVIRDMATSLKHHGFTHVVLLGDSGGNTAGLRAVAQDLSAKWGDAARIVHVPEYYNWTGQNSVRTFVNSTLGITENPGADGFHDEYGLTAVMMLSDPRIVRYDERVKAAKATINGISLEPKEKTIEMGRKIVEFRANAAVEAIKKAIGGSR